MIIHRAKKDKRNKGFTLVELLVVLTILAVLAAIAVPALLGYIDRARANADIVNARNCMEAAQAELAELYAFERAGEQEMTGDGVGGYNTNNQHQASAIPGSRGRNNNGDVEVTNENPTVAKEILKMADDNSPYIFIVGLGNRKDYGGEKGDLRCAYKCYVCMYMKDKNSRPIFYNGKEWTRKYPGTKNNETDENGNPIGGVRWYNAEFDALVDEAAGELDNAKRMELYKRAEEIIGQEDVVFIPLYHYSYVALTKPYVERTFSVGGVQTYEKWDINK